MLSLAGVFLLFLLPDLLYAQGKTVTGKVTDISGLPMAGVSVSVLKSTQGTVTDADGKFKIQVADNASIVLVSPDLNHKLSR